MRYRSEKEVAETTGGVLDILKWGVINYGKVRVLNDIMAAPGEVIDIKDSMYKGMFMMVERYEKENK